jgi:hypothetical protein
MGRPIALRGYGVEGLGGRQIVTILLSETPAPTWVEYFRDRAQASVLGLTSARFVKELPCREDLEMLMRSIEAIVDATNYDVRFRRDLNG